jgi:hypothetical protein
MWWIFKIRIMFWSRRYFLMCSQCKRIRISPNLFWFSSTLIYSVLGDCRQQMNFRHEFCVFVYVCVCVCVWCYKVWYSRAGTLDWSIASAVWLKQNKPWCTSSKFKHWVEYQYYDSYFGKTIPSFFFFFLRLWECKLLCLWSSHTEMTSR